MTHIFSAALLGVSISLLWEQLIQPGHVFSFIGRWLLAHRRCWWAKPLGACTVCANIWHTALAAVLLGLHSSAPVPGMAISLLLGIPLGHLLLVIVQRITYR